MMNQCGISKFTRVPPTPRQFRLATLDTYVGLCHIALHRRVEIESTISPRETTLYIYSPHPWWIGINRMCLQIGISGGHTQSEAIALSECRIVGSAIGPGLNDHAQVESGNVVRNNDLTLGVNNLLTSLIESIKRIGNLHLEINSLSDLTSLTDAITIALPGVTTLLDIGRAELAFSAFNFRTKRIIDDTWAALVGGSLQKVGIAAIAGTGASVYLGLGDFKLGKLYKLDGFGAFLGDWGSGFRLSLRLLEDAGRFFDANREYPLRSRLLNAMNRIHLLTRSNGIESLDDIQNWFDDLCRHHRAEWRLKLAGLAAAATEAAESTTDSEETVTYAAKLVTASAKELADTIKIGFQRLATDPQLTPPIPIEQLNIVCHGGQFKHSALYTASVESELRSSGFNNRLLQSRFTPGVGAALLACELSCGRPLNNLEVESIVTSIDDWSTRVGWQN